MDTQLMKYVDQVFLKYDFDRSGFLTLNEIGNFFNECLANSGQSRRVTQQEAIQYMMNMDRNMDGRISKLELYSGLKAILNDQQGYSPDQDQPWAINKNRVIHAGGSYTGAVRRIL